MSVCRSMSLFTTFPTTMETIEQHALLTLMFTVPRNYRRYGEDTFAITKKHIID